MKKAMIWFYLSSKRQLKKKTFFFLIIIFPILSFLFTKMQDSGSNGLRIALYSEKPGLGYEIIEELLLHKGFVNFYQSESQDQLIKEVESGKAECGYIFYEGLEEGIRNGKAKKQIGLISSPSTVVDKLSTEVVFSAFMNIYGGQILEKYADTSIIFEHVDQTELKEELADSYAAYKENGSTFRFEYQTLTQNKIELENKQSIVFPLRGIVSVYIFVIGLFSAVLWYRDERAGLFTPVPYYFQPWCNLISIGTPVFWAGISGFISILISGVAMRFETEILGLALYIIGITLICDILRGIFKDEIKFSGVIPLITIGCLIFCPIFINIKEIVPMLGVLEKLFLPYYYLLIFQGGSIRIILGVIVISASILCLRYVNRGKR